MTKDQVDISEEARLHWKLEQVQAILHAIIKQFGVPEEGGKSFILEIENSELPNTSAIGWGTSGETLYVCAYEDEACATFDWQGSERMDA